MGKRIGIYLIGLAINALGIALIIFSTVGAGAWDTVAIGLNHAWGLTIGICTVVTQVLVVLAIGIIERKRLQYESIIAIIIRSIFLDAWIYLVFNHINLAASWEIQWLYFIFGIISMGIGIGIYMEAHFPKSPIDGLMLAIHNRFKWSINTSRIVVELSGAVIGFILGGPVGLGTLIIALFVGKIIQMTNIKIKKIINLEGMPISHS
ncbi:MAG: YitT family protein [Bacillus sp. (in: firmicutes)]